MIYLLLFIQLLLAILTFAFLALAHLSVQYQTLYKDYSELLTVLNKRR